VVNTAENQGGAESSGGQSDQPAAPPFLFVVCQRGAEPALKTELAGNYPQLRLAFSRPGFLTFKATDETELPLRSVFARTHGWSLGSVEATSARELARQAWRLVGDRACDHVHVWQRDVLSPDNRDFRPGPTPLADEFGRVLTSAAPPRLEASPPPLNRRARPGQQVLDCVMLEPHQAWLGVHRVQSGPQAFPGGVMALSAPPHAVSRAYVKMVEALRWSRLPLRPGERVVELGAAPGGAAQALLDRELVVTGVDPADMDERVLEHRRFRHIRARGGDLKRRLYADFDWLAADVNIRPEPLLSMVEAIVTHAAVKIRGLMLTLKLADWALAEAIPSYLERVRSWGYRYVRARQLAHNRREICVAALRSRSLRRRTPGKP